jgi:hypothetical protein
MTGAMYQCEKYVRCWRGKVSPEKLEGFFRAIIGVPTGIRTPVTTVKGLGHPNTGPLPKPSLIAVRPQSWVIPVAYSFTRRHAISRAFTLDNVFSRLITLYQCEIDVRWDVRNGTEEGGRESTEVPQYLRQPVARQADPICPHCLRPARPTRLRCEFCGRLLG